MEGSFPDQHLRPSQRLLLGIGIMAAFSTMVLWPLLYRRVFWIWLAWLPVFWMALRHLHGSWVRISAKRGLSYCLKGPFKTHLGSIELHSSEIAELRLDSRPLARLFGLWDLQIVKRDGAKLPKFRFFREVPELAAALHRYLQQN